MKITMEGAIGYIATGLVSLIVGLFLERLKGKPRLLYWLPGSFLFQLKHPNVALRTDSLTIQNVGRHPATNVEIVHKARPDHFQFSTPVDSVRAPHLRASTSSRSQAWDRRNS